MSIAKLKKQKGFTLIELMIVVAIIGILAAVAIPKFADLVTKSKEAAVKGNLGAVRSALSIYYGDNEGIYPDNLYDGLTAANRYLPATSMGNFSVPRHSQGVGNSGHPGFDSTTASGVTEGDGTTFSDGGGLYYVDAAGASRYGEALIRCSHEDTRGNIWSGY